MTINENPFRDVPQGAIRSGSTFTIDTGSRPREESIEERALRRRRREAVVVGRDGGSIESGDIIQRTVITEESRLREEPPEQLTEDTVEVQNSNPHGWFEWLGRLRLGGLAPVSP